MQVVTGGYSQGKLDYVLENAVLEREGILVINEENYTSFYPVFNLPEGICMTVVDHLHLIIKAVNNREAVLSWLDSVMDNCEKAEAELTIISDELGCGIIPMDRNDRNWREDNGRIMCDLARKADSVIRLICGIPQKLK